MNIHQNKRQNAERRQFFRIEDDVSLYYQVIDAQALDPNNLNNRDMLAGCTLSTAWHILGEETKGMLLRAESMDYEIAECFKLLNAKLDLLAKAYMTHEEQCSEPRRNVSLSASGLAFDNEMDIETGTYLEVKMVLASLATAMILHAKVVYCRPNSIDQPHKLPFLVGLEYVNIREQDRETLIQYVLQRQKQQLRETKEAEFLSALGLN